MFFVIALVAALPVFTGIAEASAAMAPVPFLVFPRTGAIRVRPTSWPAHARGCATVAFRQPQRLATHAA